MNLSNRIKSRRKELGLTQTQLAELAGTTQQNIGKLEKIGDPNTSLIVPLSIALKCDPKWLELGKGDSPNKITIKKDSYYIEVLDVTARAGNGYLNSDVKEVIKFIEYDNDEARNLFKGIPSKNIKVINLKGDSMQGTFECGDAIYVDISVRSFDSDGIYVFTFGRGIYIKRLQLIKDVLRVKSDNKNYDPWDIKENEMDQLYIHGKVLFSQSMLLRKHG